MKVKKNIKKIARTPFQLRASQGNAWVSSIWQTKRFSCHRESAHLCNRADAFNGIELHPYHIWISEIGLQRHQLFSIFPQRNSCSIVFLSSDLQISVERPGVAELLSLHRPEQSRTFLWGISSDKPWGGPLYVYAKNEFDRDDWVDVIIHLTLLDGRICDAVNKR